MPFVYNIQSKAVSENYTTSGTANTEIDVAFVKPGATRAVNLIAMRVTGKGAGLTTLSGIAYRLKVFPTTASSAGTAITPGPVNQVGTPIAAVATAAAGAGGGTNAVTSGTGTAIFVGGCGSGASGPSGWAPMNADGAVTLDGGANRSVDLFSSSGTLSLNFEFQLDIQEG